MAAGLAPASASKPTASRPLRGLARAPFPSPPLAGGCNCPDNSGGGGYYGSGPKPAGEPCKHQAAIYYVLSGEIDKDPFAMFLVRGATTAPPLPCQLNASRVSLTCRCRVI